MGGWQFVYASCEICLNLGLAQRPNWKTADLVQHKYNPTNGPGREATGREDVALLFAQRWIHSERLYPMDGKEKTYSTLKDLATVNALIEDQLAMGKTFWNEYLDKKKGEEWKYNSTISVHGIEIWNFLDWYFSQLNSIQ